MTIPTISPQALAQQCQLGEVLLLDVRTPMEFQEVHATAAKNVPLDQLDPTKLGLSPDQCLYVICRSGSRGKQACEKLLAAGFHKVHNVEGGTLAWDQAGLPVVRGQKMMSLERQVRIAAGLLVLVGVALAISVHVAFVGLSAFVGAGLMFAGATDTCAMGLMLAKMPWNRVPATCSNPGVKS